MLVALSDENLDLQCYFDVSMPLNMTPEYGIYSVSVLDIQRLKEPYILLEYTKCEVLQDVENT